MESKGYKCNIFLRQRPNLLETATFELNRDKIAVIGQHRSSNLGKFFEFIKSFVHLFFYFANNRPRVAVSIGGQELCLVSYIFGTKVISFNDDPGHGIVFKITANTATELVLPKIIGYNSENSFGYPSYKELAHLHPSTFKSNYSALEKYNLQKYSYVIFREQDSVSMVYRNVSIGDFKEVVSKLENKKLKLVFSLENKKNIDYYEKRGVILKEPVSDFHSIIKYSALVITTGDTLAREASLLGVPAIYAGRRDMPINKELIKLGLIFKIDDISKIPNFIRLLTNSVYQQNYKKRAQAYLNTCANTSEIITERIDRLAKC